jgi:hypothetical protein
MKSLEEKIVDGLKEVNKEIGKKDKPPTIFDIFRIMMKHCGDDIKTVKFSGTRKIKHGGSSDNQHPN